MPIETKQEIEKDIYDLIGHDPAEGKYMIDVAASFNKTKKKDFEIDHKPYSNPKALKI